MTPQITFLQEIYRKIFHISMLIIPFFYYHVGKWDFLKIVAPITIIVYLIDHYRHKNQKIKVIFEKFFGVILRSKELEEGKLCGATYTLIAACLLALLCNEVIFITSFAILAICDAVASIVGRAFPSGPFFEKSIAGSVAFYISGLIILFFCGAIFDVSLWFYLFGFFALFCTAIIEARPSFLNIDDNFTIPASFAAIISAFDLIWGIV